MSCFVLKPMIFSLLSYIGKESKKRPQQKSEIWSFLALVYYSSINYWNSWWFISQLIVSLMQLYSQQATSQIWRDICTSFIYVITIYKEQGSYRVGWFDDNLASDTWQRGFFLIVEVTTGITQQKIVLILTKQQKLIYSDSESFDWHKLPNHLILHVP